MSTQKKITTVKNLKDSFSSALSVAFVDYQGLTNLQLEALRNQVQAKGGNFQVAKNTLIAQALGQDPKKRAQIFAGVLTGPTALVFAHENPINPLKELDKFIAEFELPQIKGGLLQRDFIDAARVLELAQLPTQEELLAKLIGQVQAPLVGLQYVLQANLRNLVYVLSAIKAKNERGEK